MCISVSKGYSIAVLQEHIDHFPVHVSKLPLKDMRVSKVCRVGRGNKGSRGNRGSRGSEDY